MYKALRFDSLYDLKDFLNENEIKPNEITAWMPLPEPYKESEENKNER